MPVRVLLIEDNPGDARLVREWLRDAEGDQFVVHHVDSVRAWLEALASQPVDEVLVDLSLPDGQGLDTYQRAHAAAPRVPVIVLSGLHDESLALQAVHAGAQDYLVKGQIEEQTLGRTANRGAARRNHDALATRGIGPEADCWRRAP